MFTYFISTGKFVSKDGTILARGYSGQGKGLNNPELQTAVGEGPIPVGLYSIAGKRDSSNTGPVTMDLTPAKGTDTLGRSLFRIHGDNKAMNFTASHGCIILPRTVRDIISRSGDRDLLVKE